MGYLSPTELLDVASIRELVAGYCGSTNVDTSLLDRLRLITSPLLCELLPEMLFHGT
jgi:hypothetical protein